MSLKLERNDYAMIGSFEYNPSSAPMSIGGAVHMHRSLFLLKLWWGAGELVDEVGQHLHLDTSWFLGNIIF